MLRFSKLEKAIREGERWAEPLFEMHGHMEAGRKLQGPSLKTRNDPLLKAKW